MNKKKLITFILSLVLCFSLASTASAELGYENYIFQTEPNDFIVDSLPELEELAADISNEYNIVVSAAIFETSGGNDEGDLTDEVYMDNFGGYDGIMLSYMYEEGTVYIAAYGRAGDMFEDMDLELLIEAFNSQDSIPECVRYYLNGAGQLLHQHQVAAEAENPGMSEEEEPQTGPDAIPDERELPRLVDEAGLLTAEEKADLMEQLDEISERQQLDVVVCTMPSFDGMNPMAFTDDFYDYNGYGYGDNRDGIIFAIDMEERNWWISTCGYGITAFTDYGQEYMAEEFLPYLSDGDYYQAFSTYAMLCDELIQRAYDGNPLDSSSGPDSGFWVSLIFGALAIGFLIALFDAKRKKSKLKSVVNQYSASDYTRPGSMQLWASNDMYITRHVTSRTIKTESSSDGGGGSSTHTSSSGSTHGGSGGSF